MTSPYAGKGKRKSRGTSSDRSDFLTVSKKALTGGAAALGTSVLLSLICAALCLLYPDPAALTLPAGIIIFFISAAAGGAVSSIGLKGRTALAVTTAVFCGFLIFIVTGICAVWQSSAAPESSHGIPLILAMILRFMAIPTSAISAYFASKNKNKGRRRRR